MEEVYRSGDTIYINKPKANKLAYTEYNEELFKLLKSYTWSINGDYLRSGKLNKYLHRYVMEFYYGEESIKEADERGFVVDHIDNNGFNCRISNLCFIPNDLNKAKGLTFDKRRREMVDDLTLTFYKDFKTGQFQITISFNKEFVYVHEGKVIQVDRAYYLYENDFELVLNDASKILQQVQKNGEFDETKLSHQKMLYVPSTYIELKESEKEGSIIERNGKHYLILNDKVRLGKTPLNLDIFNNTDVE
ncbi:hypothetical protein J27TS8_24990 [Robertmurraya siralis]|uniref:HNH nuclease domain-containing protein n=1 Tax=Robertmurraya siralis TaxID=77777 RepID=A0A919WIU1_9BACI|nr:HNH endonuclease [Robertmurraya siralis]GIN62506.1 hypothetical protein J27TS8_24990 [Robertmurraya siralis]